MRGIIGGDLTPSDTNPDVFLGKLQALGVDIQEECAKIIKQAKTHNALHSALLSLFPKQSAKIVTTNFDLLFEYAASEKKIDLQVFHAPALPIGSDFAGIVHLHGSIHKHSNRMVLSDADFGRAYLTEGWARRFVVQLLEKYTVLFVGYSHNDAIMQYLARGLAEFGNTKRFALCKSDDVDLWRYRGIEPIEYKTYDDLPIAIEKFAQQINGGILQIRGRFKEILEKENPPEDMDDVSYLKAYLENGKGVEFFEQFAKSDKYINWLYDRGFFDAFWQKDRHLERHEQILAYWLFDVCTNSNMLFEVFAKKLNYKNIILNDEILAIAARSFVYGNGKQMSEEDFDKWISLLVSSNSDDVGFRQFLWNIFLDNVGKRNDNAMFLLFDFLTTRFLVFQKHWDVEGKVTANFIFDIQDAVIYLESSEIFVFARRNAMRALILLIHKIEIMSLHEGAWDNYDMFRIDRNAIEPHEQNHAFGEFTHLLIDIAREALDELLAKNHTLANNILEFLAASSARILNRLALYGIWKATHIGVDNKFLWLVKHGCFVELHLEHETFKALEAIYPIISIENKQILFGTIDELLEIDSEEYMLNHVTSIVYRLLNLNASCVDTKNFYAKLLKKYPNFEETEYSDIRGITMCSGGMEYSGKSAQEFLDEISVADAVALLNAIGDENIPSWNNSFFGFSQAVAKNFEYGVEIANFIVAKPYSSMKIWRHLFFEWEKMALTREQVKAIVGFASKKGVCEQGNAWAITNFLQNYAQNDDKKALLPVGLTWRASLAVWQAILGYESEREVGDKLFELAINHPAGMLVSFWLKILNTMVDAKNKRILPRVFKRGFEAVLQADGITGQYSRALLGTNLRFLFWFDRPWFEQAILPAMDDDKNDKALDIWNGFFHNAAWGDDLLSCVYAPLEKVIGNILNGRDKAHRGLDSLCAGILLYSQDDKNIALVDVFLTNAEPEDIYQFLFVIWHTFQESEKIDNDKIWSERIKQIGEKFKVGKIKPFERRVMFMLAKMSLHLEHAFPEAVNLLCSIKCPGDNSINGGFFHELKNKSIDKYHGEYLNLIAHLLPSDAVNDAVFLHCEKIIEITERLYLIANDTENLKVICEKLIKCKGIDKISKYLLA